MLAQNEYMIKQSYNFSKRSPPGLRALNPSTHLHGIVGVPSVVEADESKSPALSVSVLWDEDIVYLAVVAKQALHLPFHRSVRQAVDLQGGHQGDRGSEIMMAYA